MQLNPHPAGQLEFNIPKLQNGTKLLGMQHNIKKHAYFSKPKSNLSCILHILFQMASICRNRRTKFATNESNQFNTIFARTHEITDILFTGGDPMIMNSTNTVCLYRYNLRC